MVPIIHKIITTQPQQMKTLISPFMNITALQQTLAWFSLPPTPPIVLLLTPFNVNLKRQNIDLTLYDLFIECLLIRAQTFIPNFIIQTYLKKQVIINAVIPKFTMNLTLTNYCFSYYMNLRDMSKFSTTTITSLETCKQNNLRS